MWGEGGEDCLIMNILRRERKSQEALNLVDAINKKYDVNDASDNGASLFNKWTVYISNKCF